MGKVGFMQGRLSEIIDGKIQAFPWQFWQEEFKQAKEIAIPLMEWTLDQRDLYENPFMTVEGQKKIIQLSKENELKIPSLTGDCFMQAPFWKASPERREKLIADLNAILCACNSLHINTIVIPIVDNSAITSLKEENYLIDVLTDHESVFATNGVRVAFESDFPPAKLERFINKMYPIFFGINYDIVNSASLGFNVDDEFISYGHRILNVHVKDRILGGTTVPLGFGDADFESVFSNLFKCGYSGNYILQTARDPAGKHSQVINDYLNKTCKWIADYESKSFR